MITLAKNPAPAAEYRTLLGHTLACAACRAKAPCFTRARLTRAWRAARVPWKASR
ncbi:hypothetical protein OG609_44820 (plasmid) [Streptomyces sp. NBC_01224]|uniref:hypothetical protein n=1 Tax=Streptomyces sp. NBC_01224 TaxID=2903783 RepID=UPI002E166C82|nr:hypothetical protein OG609_44820 [Streptomyces sp. NBC_01224]